MITAEQVKAARKLLGWSQLRLSIEANLALQTLGKFETGKVQTQEQTILVLCRTLESAGVEFPEAEPPRLKTGAAYK